MHTFCRTLTPQGLGLSAAGLEACTAEWMDSPANVLFRQHDVHRVTRCDVLGALEAERRQIDACLASATAMRLLERPGREEPRHQRRAADAQRVLEALPWTGAAVDGHSETGHLDPGH